MATWCDLLASPLLALRVVFPVNLQARGVSLRKAVACPPVAVGAGTRRRIRWRVAIHYT